MDHLHINRRSFIRGSLLAAATSISQARASKEKSLHQAELLLEGAVQDGTLRSASLHVRSKNFSVGKAVGSASPETVFLIASISKPLTAAGVMLLVDSNELKLNDPVQKYIPEFREGKRDRITIQHLLTHTSGLPDQLPENVELRKRQAPLEEFVERAIRTPLLFEPGQEVRYQSMGFLLASEVVRRITGQPFRKFLREQLFLPMGMGNTELGLGRFTIADTAQSQVEAAPELYGGGSDTQSWNWNSQYWRDLGVPWGGVHSNGSDLERFLRYFLSPDGSVLKVDTAKKMISNQNVGLAKPWGLGFMVQSKGLGAFCSPETFGHSGSTGTLCWADPRNGASMVLLTTLPARVSSTLLLKPVSNLVGQACG
jgi:CubicO group peptidase (beta-lactamase class C family)